MQGKLESVRNKVSQFKGRLMIDEHVPLEVKAHGVQMIFTGSSEVVSPV